MSSLGLAEGRTMVRDGVPWRSLLSKVLRCSIERRGNREWTAEESLRCKTVLKIVDYGGDEGDESRWAAAARGLLRCPDVACITASEGAPRGLMRGGVLRGVMLY